MSKKRLDELFQEKFKGFEETPDEKVWSSIEASLDRKKKKRILPIWWQLAGVAAVFLAGLLLFNPFGNKTTLPESNEVTDTEHIENDKRSFIDSLDTNKVQIGSPNIESITQTENKRNAVSEESITNTDVSNTSDSYKKDVVRSANKESIGQTMVSASVENQHNDTDNSITKDVLSDTNPQESEVVVSKNINTTKDGATNQEAKPSIGKESINSNTAVIASNNTEKIAETKTSEGKKSLYDDIKEEQDEEVIATKSPRSKWSAGPSVAPVYFDAIGNGSPVSPVFSTNSKSGNVNMSYGVSIAYEISPKLSLRSGVHKVDYGYDTNDVYFTSSLSALSQNRIANINYAETAENLVVSSNSATLNLDSKSFDVSARTANRSGVMAQQLGYLEVPLELSYALVDSKFGVNVIGGVSSLFLVDNEVDLTSGNLTTQIGEANNINELNFSANFGIGLGYQFSKKLKLNVEPVFKYQLNTFSNVDGTFNPYTIGVYSGINFKF